MRRIIGFCLLAALAASACGASSDPKIDAGNPADYAVSVGPGDFVARVDNPWLPFVPGAMWVYEGREDDEIERIEVEVLSDTRLINGVTATVVRDTVYVDGELVEDTFDWYAQDAAGNVWYLGEASTEYEDGRVVGTSGSWEWGVDGALPGVVMWADPQVGQAYRQEFYEGEAEDVARVARRGATVAVPAGSFTEVLVISEWNPLEPDVLEEKYYARGVGVVKEQKIEGGTETVELISFTAPG